MSENRFGDRLKQLREQAGLTQAQLAERAGLRQPHVARYESGRMRPNWETLQRLAQALGAKLEDFR